MKLKNHYLILATFLVAFFMPLSTAQEQYDFEQLTPLLETLDGGYSVGNVDKVFNDTSRVVNGIPESHENVPFFGALVLGAPLTAYDGSIYAKGSAWCGGWLVTPDVFQTNAHCLNEKEFVYPANYHDARLAIAMTDTLLPGQVAEEITAYIQYCEKHPDYNRPMYYSNDYALCKLDRSLPMANVRRATSADSLPTGKLLTVCGFGNTTSFEDLEHLGMSLSTELLCTEVPVIDDRRALQRTMPYQSYVPLTIYAGYFDGRTDSGGGDSGGPLFERTPDGWIVHGSVAFGLRVLGGYTELANVNLSRMYLGQQVLAWERQQANRRAIVNRGLGSAVHRSVVDSSSIDDIFSPNTRVQGKITRVIDGDTIVARLYFPFLGMELDRIIRLSGIDTPEPKGETKAEGVRIGNYVREVALDELATFNIEPDDDDFGRLLAYIYLEDLGETSLNLHLLQQDMAKVN